MADEFQDKLNAILGNPDIMKAISALSAGMGGGSSQPVQNSDSALPAQTPDSSDAVAGLASMVNSLSDENDSRINLLYALRPYMRSGRAEHMDMAIKILKLTKLTSLL